MMMPDLNYYLHELIWTGQKNPVVPALATKIAFQNRFKVLTKAVSVGSQ